MPDTRARPLASVRLFAEGQGDAVLSSQGRAWLDQLWESHSRGSSNRTTAGLPYLEYLEGIGLTCRPFPVRKDTRLTNYTVTPSTSWEEAKPAWGSRVYRLHQWDTTAAVQWSAVSKYDLPANPHLVLSLTRRSSPPDWDSATYPPYVQFELGAGSRKVFVRFDQDGAHLIDYQSGVARAQSLPHGNTLPAYGDDAETLIFLRCLRGRVGVSLDLGQSYHWAGSDEDRFTLAAAPLTVRGQGGAISFGLSQLQYLEGEYTSQTFGAGAVWSAPAVTPEYWADVNPDTAAEFGTVTIDDLSDYAAGILQYRATLTPTTISATGFDFYEPPVLFNVTLDVPPATVVGTGLGTYTTPWDSYLTAVSWDKPYDLDDAGLSLDIKSDPFSLFSTNLRNRKILLRLGHQLEDASTEYVDAGMWYISEPDLDYSQEWGVVDFRLRCRPLSAVLHDKLWTSLDLRHLGGMTANDAADYVLSRVGWNSSYRSWHATGDLFTLAAGKPEDPTWMLRKGESAWETLQRIFQAAGLELALADAGGLVTAPYGSTTATTWVRRLSPSGSSELRDHVAWVRNTLDYQQTPTCVVVEGVGQDGQRLQALAVDTASESYALRALTLRFQPWRQLHQEELPGTVPAGLLASRAQALAQELFALKVEPQLCIPVDLRFSRRDMLQLYGAEGVGIADGTLFVILAIRHEYRAGASLSDLRSHITLRML